MKNIMKNDEFYLPTYANIDCRYVFRKYFTFMADIAKVMPVNNVMKN